MELRENNFDSVFIREVEIENIRPCILKIAQMCIGDVGAVVWDAGLALAKYLDYASNKNFSLKNKKILELGSGTGVVGLLAAVLGADVIVTDLPEQIPLLKKNIELNENIITGSIQAEVLQWGEPCDISKPDVVLISDCIYYEKCLDELIKTILDLKGKHTEFLISYEERSSLDKKKLVNKFLSALEDHFDVYVIEPNEQHPYYRSSDIHILKAFSKKPSDVKNQF